MFIGRQPLPPSSKPAAEHLHSPSLCPCHHINFSDSECHACLLSPLWLYSNPGNLKWSPHIKLLNFITSVKFLLLKRKQSQIPGIKTWRDGESFFWVPPAPTQNFLFLKLKIFYSQETHIPIILETEKSLFVIQVYFFFFFRCLVDIFMGVPHPNPCRNISFYLHTLGYTCYPATAEHSVCTSTFIPHFQTALCGTL